MGKLDGKIVLITGGSKGIGLATAQEFIAEGAYVFITGRRQQVLDIAVEQLGNKNVVTAIQADSSKLTDLDNVVKIIEEKKGKLNILFVNAGIAELSSIDTITEHSFDTQFNVNGGSIIFVESSWSIQSQPRASVYSATKAAVRSFARCWSVDLKDRKIRVNTISPGTIDTSMIRGISDTKEESEKMLQDISANSLMGRLGKPSEIAKVVVFLASDDSSYITGIILFIVNEKFSNYKFEEVLKNKCLSFSKL